jgi:orotidine 5'-phosphate decarboxylase subfamily 2
VRRYLDKLAIRSGAVRSVLCLGMDPQPEALPEGFPATLAGVERFCEILLDVALPYAAAVKPNLAFFEVFGHEGIAVLERLRSRVPGDVPFVADAKRGDIGSTAARQAVALYDILAADAVTVNPYLGSEAVEPLISRADRFAYLLCRTSNPGAGELQGLEVAPDPSLGAPAEPVYARLARRATTWGPGGTVGLVVGATAPAELEEIRGIAPRLPFLVPGVGAQGGDVGPVLVHGPARTGTSGGGLLVNVSRGISGAAAGRGDPERLIAEAAAEWSERLSTAGLGNDAEPAGSGSVGDRA